MFKGSLVIQRVEVLAIALVALILAYSLSTSRHSSGSSAIR